MSLGQLACALAVGAGYGFKDRTMLRVGSTHIARRIEITAAKQVQLFDVLVIGLLRPAIA